MLRPDSFPPEIWEAICTPMHEILPRGARSSGSGALWLGSWSASVDSEQLGDKAIKAIVECHESPWATGETTGSPPSPPAFTRTPTSPGFQQGARPPLARSSSMISSSRSGNAGSSQKDGDKFARFKVPVPDSSSPDLLKPHLEGAVRFIDEQLSGGENVLVHCQQGISRSAAITIAYIMRTFEMNYDQAHAAVKAKRKCIRPNSGFERTLRESWQ